MTTKELALESLSCMFELGCSSFLALFSLDKDWVVLCWSLFLAAIKRANGEAAGPSFAP